MHDCLHLIQYCVLYYKHILPASIISVKNQLTFGTRERQFASLIWQRQKIGRREIHQLTGVHPTLTGNAVALLIESGLVRDAAMQPSSDRGRPQVPVEIDPDRRQFLGLSISPGAVRVAKVDPSGQLRGSEQIKKVNQQNRIVEVAAALLAEHIDRSTFAIGISFTGLVDPQEQAILFSSSLPSGSAMSLKPILASAGHVPVVLHNDMHALALRWLLTSGSKTNDMLLVGLGDGSLGASVLMAGQPHAGSVSAGNELGHTRLAIPTDRCYCGQEGCLERIFSTAQLKRFGSTSDRSLDQVLEDAGPDRTAIAQVLDHLVTGISNAVNFIRPEKLVIASPLVRHPQLTKFLRDQLPARILPGLRERVETVFWQQSSVQSAENAAWLALADVFGQSLEV